MRSIGVIPARFDSKRFPGKPLALIDNKPLIQHVWQRAKMATLLDDVIVATDDERIFSKVEEFGGKCVMTSSDIRSGSDRVAEVAKDSQADIVLNIQGDEPFIEPALIDDVVGAFDNRGTEMVTAVRRADAEDDIPNPNLVKVVFDKDWNALNFSRTPIPDNQDNSNSGYWIHLGIYGYTRDFLLKFAAMDQTPLELSESLEQLRAIENGYGIKLIETAYKSFPIDTESDLNRANEEFEKYVLEKSGAA